MDIWHWTPLVTLTPARRPFLAAQGAVRAGADRRRQPLPDLLAHHPADDPAGDPGAVFIRLMDALRTVDEVWMLTGGGPGAATRYVGLHIWRWSSPRPTTATAAMSLLTLYLTIVMCWLLYGCRPASAARASDG